MDVLHSTAQTSSQVVTTADVNSVQGSYVSLLADIASIEENAAVKNEPNSKELCTDDHVETQSVTFSAYPLPSSYSLLDSQENTSLKNSMITYENISYAVTQSVGGSPQFVLLQQTDSNNANFIQLVPQTQNQTDLGYNVHSHVSLQHAANLPPVAVSVHSLGEASNVLMNSASLLVRRGSHGDVSDVTLIPEQDVTSSKFQDPSRPSGRKTYVKKNEISAACIKRFTADDLNMDSNESEILKRYLEQSKGTISKEVKTALKKKLDGTEFQSTSCYSKRGSVNQFENRRITSMDNICENIPVMPAKNSDIPDIDMVSRFIETQTSKNPSKKHNKNASQRRKSSTEKKQSVNPNMNLSNEVFYDYLEEEQSNDWGTEHRLSLDIEKLIQLSEEDSQVVLRIFPETLMLLTEKDLFVEMEFEQDADVTDFKACTAVEGKKKFCLSVTGKHRDAKKKTPKKRTKVSGAKNRKQPSQKHVTSNRRKANSLTSSAICENRYQLVTQSNETHTENGTYDTIDVRACFGDDMDDDSQYTVKMETMDDLNEDTSISAAGAQSEETELEPNEAASPANASSSQTRERRRDYMKGRKKPAYKSFKDESGNRFFLCHTCHYVTEDRKDMYQHAIAHVKTLDYQCEVCGQTFKFATFLNAHKRLHNEKVFPCSECSKSFPDPRNLAKHMKWHLNVKPNICDHCGRGFVISSDLKKHVRIHTGENPFKCEECGRRFSDGSSWRRHKKTHIPAKFVFVCSKCNRHYARLDICNTHIKRTHPEFRSGEIKAIKQDITEIENREEHSYTKPEGGLKTAKQEANVKT